MSDDTDREHRTEAPGRRIQVRATGDNAAELELSALDEARPFFGDGPQLAIIPDYMAYPAASSSSPAVRDSGKRYQATVLVRTVEPS